MSESTTIIEAVDTRSELEKWRDAKKEGTPHIVPAETKTEPVAEAAAAPVEVEEPEPAIEIEPVPADQPKKQERWQDPETGETLDMRRRSSRRIQKLVERVKSLERTLAERGERSPATPRTDSLPAAGARQAVSRTDDPEPTEQDFPDNWPAFIAAHAAWTAKQETKKVLESRDQEREHAAFVESYKKDQEAYRGRAMEFAKTHPDFRDVTREVVASDVMFHAVFASEHGPRIAFWLGKNPEKAKELAQRTQHYGAADMPLVREYLETLTSPPVVPEPVVRPVSKAPAPIKPLTGAATPDPLPKDPRDMSLAEWRARKRAKAG